MQYEVIWENTTADLLKLNPRQKWLKFEEIRKKSLFNSFLTFFVNHIEPNCLFLWLLTLFLRKINIYNLNKSFLKPNFWACRKTDFFFWKNCWRRLTPLKKNNTFLITTLKKFQNIQKLPISVRHNMYELKFWFYILKKSVVFF